MDYCEMQFSPVAQSLPGRILMMWRLGVYMMPFGVPHLLVLEIVGMNEGIMVRIILTLDLIRCTYSE